MWNSYMMEDMQALGISQSWMRPIIQGYVGCFSTDINGKSVETVLISRRSINMGGTRYNSRGINDEGHVANFVETELIMLFDQFLTSYICVRGSVPTFWSQVGMNAPIKVTRSVDLSSKAFIKHAT